MPIPKELLDLMTCPKCDSKLLDKGDKAVCAKCRLKFRVEDGVPNMILDYAEKF